MAEATLKRSRDEETALVIVDEHQEETKRYKSSASASSATSTSSPYNQILSILEEDEEEPNQDLSSLITSLQQEISSEPITEPTSDSEPNNGNLASVDSSTTSFEDEEDKERVIKHLLEASDDELGIPTGEVSGDFEDDGVNGGNRSEFAFCDGLWEFEDETANYYTLLQSELFM